jgi:ribose transport system permease protein
MTEPAALIDANIDEIAAAPPPLPPLKRMLGSSTAGYLLVFDVLLIAFFSLASHGHVFASWENAESVIGNAAEGLLLAIGLTIMLSAGIFDLSLGANLILSSVAGAIVLQHLVRSGAPSVSAGYAILAAAVCIAAGALFGLVNGVLIAYVGINSLIATLGTLGIGTGIALVLTSGSDISGLPASLQTDFALKQVLRIPLPALIAVLLTVVLWAVLKYTRYGMRTLAIGSNRAAAEYSGLVVRRHLVTLAMLGGCLAGLAGFIDIARFGSTNTAGHTLDALNAATAVVIGGTALMGGRASMFGTLWGIVLTSVLLDGLIVMNVQSFYQQIATGVILIVAVATDRFRAARRVLPVPAAWNASRSPGGKMSVSIRRRAVVSMTAGAVLALGAAACSSSASSTSSGNSPATAGSSSSTAAAGTTTGFKLAGSAGLGSDPFWITLMCGGTQAAAAAGSTITWHSEPSATSGNAQEEQDIQAAQLDNPDGMVLSPVGTESYTPILSQFNSKGVPVEEVNAPSAATNYYQAVVSPVDDPNVATMAHLIAQGAGSSGSVAVLAIISGVPVIEARWQPLVSELKTLEPGLTVLPTQYDNADANKAASIVSALLVAHPDLKAIWTTSGPEGEGAVEAVKAAGKEGTVKVYSFDATPDLVTALQQGTVSALLAQSPYLMGQRSVQDLISYLKARHGGTGAPGTASPQQVIVPTMILTKANINTAAAQQYEYKATCG